MIAPARATRVAVALVALWSVASLPAASQQANAQQANAQQANAQQANAQQANAQQANALDAVSSAARAQDAVAPSTPLTLHGRVVKQTLGSERPVAREMVTLHRVNASNAGPVDSARTDAAGRYRFRVLPDSTSVYLVSAHHGGIAYFSTPARAGDSPAPAEIVVYDTTSRDVPLSVQGRHLIVATPNAKGVRTVLDVLEIQNDTSLTRVAGSANRPTFSLLLPKGATNARVAQGDISDAGVTMSRGRADVYAALSPGMRQLVLSYDVGVDAFPLAVPLERPIGVLEVLLEEATGRASGSTLRDQGPVSVDGREFRRYLGQDAAANGVVRISYPALEGAGDTLPPWVIPLALTVLTLGALLAAARRSPVAVPAGAAGAPMAGAGATRSPAGNVRLDDRPDAERLAGAIAAVDALARSEVTPARAREGLGPYRARLVGELRDALARDSGAR